MSREYTVTDTESWIELTPQKGDVLECDVPEYFSFKDPEKATFKVVSTDVTEDGGFAVRVTSLGSEDSELSKKLSNTFNRRPGYLHLCGAMGVCNTGGECAFHVTALTTYPASGPLPPYVSTFAKRQLKDAQVDAPSRKRSSPATPKSSAAAPRRRSNADKGKGTGLPQGGSLSAGNCRAAPPAPKPDAVVHETYLPSEPRGSLALGSEEVAGLKARLSALKARELGQPALGDRRVHFKEDAAHEGACVEVPHQDRGLPARGVLAHSEEPWVKAGAQASSSRSATLEKIAKKRGLSGVLVAQAAEAVTRKTSSEKRGEAKKQKKKDEGPAKALLTLLVGKKKKKKKKEQKKKKAKKGERRVRRTAGGDGDSGGSDDSSDSTTSSSSEESEDEEEEEQVGRLQPPLKRKSDRRPGSVLALLLQRVEEQMADVHGDREEAISITEGSRLLSYFTVILRPAHYATSKEMRELHMLSIVLDQLRQGLLGRATDTLAARYLSLLQFLQDGAWDAAQWLEIHPQVNSAGPPPELQLAARRHARLVDRSLGRPSGRGRWQPSFLQSGQGDWQGGAFRSRDPKGKDKKGKGKSADKTVASKRGKGRGSGGWGSSDKVWEKGAADRRWDANKPKED
ncbi:unnamed protein product [Effrenium voratum]|uniref:Uncharacterized protein n=1 Tax=Effrenium voratum TaxID=2562239 RepID=A0AA36NEQ6_9DINO|nr:unnamed protein product [Effrenium voratum]CAJ1456411.1 unnamed protein product [Effrenium voratum]